LARLSWARTSKPPSFPISILPLLTRLKKDAGFFILLLYIINLTHDKRKIAASESNLVKKIVEGF
jgi:hypothetical protein